MADASLFDASLMDAWRALKSDDPTLRARDAAERLGVSEGALAEARRGAGESARLDLAAPEALGGFIEGLKPLGRVMTLTRNAACVHETYGPVAAVKTFGAMGQITGPIDLRLFFSEWRAVYHIEEQTRSGRRRSFQVFDAFGDSALKIYAVEETDAAAWSALAARLTLAEAPPLTYEAGGHPERRDPPDAEIDLERLRAGWRTLEHSHDFHRLLRETGAGRLQALRLIGAPLAEPTAPEAVGDLLQDAAAAELELMLFVGNPGCVQIFTGPVRTLKPMGPWLNVMDPEFHMHLRLDRIASSWLVRKPTSLRGEITSLELYDAAGELILQIFGARAPGAQENPAWRALVARSAKG